MAEQQKINKYSLADLKNTTDDAIPTYLNSIGYKQVHKLTDVRLTLGFSACIIAAITFYYDYKFGFEASKPFTFYAVIAYFTLNTALTWWIWQVEAGVIYLGEKEGVKLEIKSTAEKHSPYYHATFKVTSKNGTSREETSKDSFTSWFTEDGVLAPKPLQKFLDAGITAATKKSPNADQKVKI